MTEEDKGAYKYCKNCGRVLSPTSEAELCPTCEENQLFDKVRDYIRKNDVTEMQVAEHFGIPQKKVKAWIKEGRIEYKEDGDKRALVSIRCARSVSYTHLADIKSGKHFASGMVFSGHIDTRKKS